jgi:hypothetical protein
MASDAKFQGMHKSARLVALQITGLSVAHLPLVLDDGASACGLSGARYMEIRYILALHLSYMFREGLRDTFQCVPPPSDLFMYSLPEGSRRAGGIPPSPHPCP